MYRYIPNKRTQYEYPGNYAASDTQSCQADSNLLLHEDPYPYPDPNADPYEDSPDSQHSQCPAEQAESQAQVNATGMLFTHQLCSTHATGHVVS